MLIWTLAFVNNTWGSEGSSVNFQKWELWICFVSRNMFSVVETVNGIGLLCGRSGTLHGVYTLLLSHKTCMANLVHIISQWPLSVWLCYVSILHFWVISVSSWLTGETLEEPRHYMICGERRSQRGQLSMCQNMTHSIFSTIQMDWDWMCLLFENRRKTKYVKQKPHP